MLSLLFDIKEFAEQVEAQMIELNENAIMEAYFCLGHTVQGLYRNLCNRQTTIQLRAEREASPGRHTAVRAAQLDFVEADTVRSDVLDRWFPEFEELKTGQNLKHAARRGTREYSTKESLKGAGWRAPRPNFAGAVKILTRGLARSGRQRTGSLLGAGRGADEMGGRVARSLRPRGIARDVTEKQLEFLGEEMQKGPKDGGVHESDTKIAREQSLSQCRSPGPTSGETGRRRGSRAGESRRHRWLASRRCNGLGRPAHVTGARVLPCMDDFLVLCDSEAEALRVREMVTRMLRRLGIERNENKGVWEPMQLPEHLGLEVDTANG
eukprot:gene9865-biopygen10086